MRECTGQYGGSLELLSCRIRKVGFSYYVNLHVIVDGKISVSQGHSIAHEVEDKVLRSAPRVAEVLVHVEPDDKDHLAKLRGK